MTETKLPHSRTVTNPSHEWQGMPEFSHTDKTSFRRIIVHFKDQDAIDRFSTTIGQRIGQKVRSIWFPQAEIERYADKAYQADA